MAWPPPANDCWRRAGPGAAVAGILLLLGLVRLLAGLLTLGFDRPFVEEDVAGVSRNESQ